MPLDSLLSDEQDLKFIFVGGKGGVGKTTSSSAIATIFSKYTSKRVLLVSTDPAHSLADAFRTKFSNTPTCPSPDELPNLKVMEVDPTDTMQRELSKWSAFAEEMMGDSSAGGNSKSDNGRGGADATMAAGSSEWVEKIRSFQEWLSGIPGIDEATALSTAIQHIESGEYDLIVFDTAPTGHTLKLLGMPQILQAGIDKLQSWQSTLWTYWETFKGLSSSGSSSSPNTVDAKRQISAQLERYQHDIQKVSLMLQDQQRTRFVVVCIAEYLSISETRRLLTELKTHDVRASHIIVNQLVTRDALTPLQLEELEGMAEVGELGHNLDPNLLRRTVHACRLTTARKGIQEKYLNVLKSCNETMGIKEGICEVPLLAEEVTGITALEKFGDLLITTTEKKNRIACAQRQDANEQQSTAARQPLYDDVLSIKNKTSANPDDTSDDIENVISSWTPGVGDVVKVRGLAKAPHYNDLEGGIVSDRDNNTGRYGITVVYQGKKKALALLPKNLTLVTQGKKHKSGNNSSSASSRFATSASLTTSSTGGNGGGGGGSISDETMSKAKQVLDDPEIRGMIDSNPRFEAAVQDVMSNPLNFMKYLSDPEMSPLLRKAMEKFRG